MLKLLLRLYFLQKKREFKWQDLVVGIYLVLLFAAIVVAVVVGIKDGDSAALASYHTGSIFLLTMLVPDILLKAFMKHDPTAMDDYIKARPIPTATWTEFLLVRNVFDFWNYALPLTLMAIMLFAFDDMPSLGASLLTFILLMAYSFADGILITCYHKTSQGLYKFLLIVGWIMMSFIVVAITVLSLWLGEWAQETALLLFALTVIACLAIFLNNMPNYNVVRHKVSRKHNFGRATMFKVQLLGILRVNNVRLMIFIFGVIFVFDSYMLVFTATPDTTSWEMAVPVSFAILMPSAMLAQMTFSVEANFFQGLMTKPVSIAQLLCNTFYISALLSLVFTIIVSPLAFITNNVTLSFIVGVFFFSLFNNLFSLPTCLSSSRIELFTKSVFGAESGKFRINVYSLAMLALFAVFAGIYYYFGETVFCWTSIISGIVSWLLHKRVAQWLGRVFMARRYKRMQRFME